MERVVIKLFDQNGRQIAELPIPNPAVEAYNQGTDLAQAGKLTEAVDYFLQAVQIEPRYTDAHYNLAVTYYALGRLTEARQEYERVLELRPRDVDSLNNLATILAIADQVEEAKILLDRALEIDPDFALTHRNLAAYYQRQGDFGKSLEHVTRARALNPGVFDQDVGEPRQQSRIDF